MPEELLTFKRFKDPDIANDIAEKLKSAKIYFEIENDDKFFDATFANNPMAKETRIKLKPTDFIKAEEALEKYYQTQLINIDRRYYLFGFSNKELFEILEKPDEWGDLDYQLSKRILIERGENLQQTELDYLKEKRIKELSKPEKSSTRLILAGYVSAIFGGIFGIIIGRILANTKTTLPNGKIIYTYTDSDRSHGNTISIIGIAVIAASLLRAFIWSFNR